MTRRRDEQEGGRGRNQEGMKGAANREKERQGRKGGKTRKKEIGDI